MYITKLLSVSIIYKEHWMNFNTLILFQWYLLKLCFFTRYLYFHHNWGKERGIKIDSSNIFEECYWKKNLEIHKHSWFSIIWIFKKLNSLKSNCLTNYLPSKATFSAKLIKNNIRYLELSLPWKNMYFVIIIALFLFRFEFIESQL